MPYSPEHTARTRKKIVETARVLFNRHGFSNVSIDQIMAMSGLTRGGFYNHFKNKDELYAEAVASFLNGRGKTWHDAAGIDPINGGPETVCAMIDSYLSDQHLGDLDGQCPMIALPSDVARATPEARKAYGELLQAMTWLFENNIEVNEKDKRTTALAMSALCVGGMVLSRTIENPGNAAEIRSATRGFALSLVNAEIQLNSDQNKRDL